MVKLPRYIDIGCYGMRGTWEREGDKPLIDDVLAKCIEGYLRKILGRNDVYVNVKIEYTGGSSKLGGDATIYIGEDIQYGALFTADISIEGNTVSLSDVYLEIVEKLVKKNDQWIRETF